MNSHVPTVPTGPAAAGPAETSTSQAAPRLRQAWPVWLGALLLILPTLAAYLPAMNARFIWDDDRYLTQTVHNFIVPSGDDLWATDGLKKIWTTTATEQYYPLVFTTFWLEYRLWGRAASPSAGEPDPPNAVKFVQSDGRTAWFRPAGFHITNIVLHALSAVLLWRILAYLQVPGAWLAAAVFALHPVQVESVAWVTERKNVLSGLFYMAAALTYLHFAYGKGRMAWLGYPVAFMLFVLALLSKTVTCSLPVALLLAFWLRKQRPRASALVGLVPMLALGVVMGRLTSWYEFHKQKYWEPMPIRKAFELSWKEGRAETAQRSGYALTHAQRVLIASRSLLKYAEKLILPRSLSLFYYRWSDKPGGELDPLIPLNWWPLFVLVGLAAGTIGLAAIWGRGVFIGAAFFVMTLFPALGFFDLWPMRYSFWADHFQYLACIGLVALLCAGLARAFGFLGEGRPVFNGTNPPGAIAAAALLVALGAATWARAGAFHDSESIYLDTIWKVPTAWIAHNNLGVLYAERKEYDKAIERFQYIVDKQPDFSAHGTSPHANLASALYFAKDYRRAEAAFREAIRRNPRLGNLHVMLGLSLLEQNDPAKAAEAASVFERAMAFFPNDERVKRYRANALAKAGGAGRAASAPTTAAASGPAPIDLGGATTPQERRMAYIRLAEGAIRQGDFIRAMTVIQAGLTEIPQSQGLWQNYALLLAASPLDEQRNGAQAVAVAERLRDSLTRIGRLEARTMEILAAAYAESGRFDDAIKAAQDGLRLVRPDRDADVQGRLEAQLNLYKAKQPYRIHAALPAPSTRPVRRPT